MQTECSSAEQFKFEGFERRRVVAAFDGSAVSSDAGALLLRHTERTIGLIERVAACFRDGREQDQVIHTLPALAGQRIVGIALGYEDVNDHDELRHDPVLALFADGLEPKRADCAPLAGKSTLNRLEHAPLRPDDRYHKIRHDPAALANLFVDLFLEAHKRPPTQIVLDLDASDDPLHGQQEGRFFHGYYSCYCYLPLYVLCGRHLLAALLRPANIDVSAGAVDEIARIVARVRQVWPRVQILFRERARLQVDPAHLEMLLAADQTRIRLLLRGALDGFRLLQATEQAVRDRLVRAELRIQLLGPPEIGLRPQLTLPGSRRRGRRLKPIPNGASTRPFSSWPQGALRSQPGMGKRDSGLADAGLDVGRSVVHALDPAGLGLAAALRLADGERSGGELRR